MTRRFLSEKGLSKEVIDEILDENSKDIGKAKRELDSVKAQLEIANKDKEGLKQQIEALTKVERRFTLTVSEEINASAPSVPESKIKIEFGKVFK